MEDRIQLSTDLRGSISAMEELRRAFDFMYPDTFYCYGDGTIEYSYEIEEINKTSIPVEGTEQLNWHNPDDCGRCWEGGRAWIVCRDNEYYWRPHTESEARQCRPCREVKNDCYDRTINKEIVTKIPINVTVSPEPGAYTEIDLKNLSHDNRVRVFWQIKDEDCYTTLKIYNNDALEYIPTITFTLGVT